jgi:type VI secretion system secreted protein VgrG
VRFSVPRQDSDHFDLAGAMGEKATVVFNQSETPEKVHGEIVELELLDAVEHEAVYRVTLAPRVWHKLGQSRHSRVFVDESIPDVISDILKNAGFSPDKDFVLDLKDPVRGDYPKMEHVSQYQESDLAFISRWMEREGIYYFFAQRDDQEKLIITNSRKTHEDYLAAKPRKRYFPLASEHDESPEETFRRFRWTQSLRPASVRLFDSNYLTPGLAIDHTQDAADGTASVSIHDQNVANPGEAKRIARIRAEELRARQVQYGGVGCAYGLRAGYLFELVDHPKITGQLLVVDIASHGTNLWSAGGSASAPNHPKESFTVEVTAIPADAQYRPPRVTPLPRVDGLETAVIDGAATDIYAQLDEHGRYLVKIRFDESDLKDGKASMRVRMLQPHGGSPEGFHFPLRKGTEVLLAFLGGDPDRPVIVGVGPTTHTPSPVTRDNATQNVIQTGGLNRLVMEDVKGMEYAHLSSPPMKSFLHLGAHRPEKECGTPDGSDDHNMVLSTDGDGLIHTGNDLDVNVGTGKAGDLTVNVQGDTEINLYGTATTYVEKELTETVDGKVDQTYNAGLKQTITAKGEVREIKDGVVETIQTGNYRQTLEEGDFIQTLEEGDFNQTIDEGDFIQNIEEGDSTQTIALGNLTQKVEVGSATLEATKEIKIESEGPITIHGLKVETEAEEVWEKCLLKKEFFLGNKFGLNVGAFAIEINANLKAEFDLLKIEYDVAEWTDSKFKLKKEEASVQISLTVNMMSAMVVIL